MKTKNHSKSIIMILKLLLLLFLCLTPSNCSLSYEDKVEESIRQVHIVMRHGMRAPLAGYPGDELNKESNWENGYGELLTDGLRMHDDLGRYFRKRYDGFLDRKPNHKQIEVISTDIDRTLNSAQANMAALFFVHNETERYNKDLPYTPVPVHTNSLKNDKLIRVDLACPGLEYLLHLTFIREEWIYEMTQKYSGLMKELAHNLKTEVNNLLTLQGIYNDYAIIQAHNFTVPSYILKHFPVMKEISNKVFEMYTCTDDLKSIRVGPLLEKISSEMKQSIDTAGESKRFLMYSGHDVTVASHLNTLGNFNGLQPPYASAVIYELHQNNATGHHFVRMMYHNDSTFTTSLHPLKLHNCNFSCPIENWKAFVSQYIPEDFETECLQGPIGPVFDGYKFIMISFGAMAVLAILVGLFCYLVKRCRRDESYYESL